MKCSPLVSIVIPCYNDGAYLREAVASAQAQTYPNCEIIIVNDHSSDEATCSLLRQLVHEGLQVLETPTGKKGLPAARNTGIAAAQGTYILPLDADDILAPSYVEKACAYMEQDSDICICTSRVAFFGLRRGEWRKMIAPSAWGLVSLQAPLVCASLFRRNSWLAVDGYDESLLKGHEDTAFWLALLEKGGRIHEIDEVLFYYRIKPHSMTAKYASEDFTIAAAAALYDAHPSIYQRFTKNFFLEIRRLQIANDRRNTSFLYRALKPLMKLEWNLRQSVKRIVGRA